MMPGAVLTTSKPLSVGPARNSPSCLSKLGRETSREGSTAAGPPAPPASCFRYRVARSRTCDTINTGHGCGEACDTEGADAVRPVWG